MCLGKFTSPRLLPCFHTFCLGCLKQLVPTEATTSSFPCPTCRTSITIPPGGLEKFQVNFYIEAEVEAAQSHTGVRTCDMCEDGSATHKCTDCDQLACDSCTKIHASISATKSHTVFTLGDAHPAGQGKPLVTRERFCDTHNGEKIRFFCTRCDRVICRDCKLTSHEGHATLDLSQKSAEARELVLKVTTMSRDVLEPKLKQVLQEAEKQKEVVRKSKAEALQILTSRAEEVKKVIDEYLATAKQQLIQESDNVHDLVQRTVDDMTHEFACFLSLTEHAQCVARDGCDADALEMPAKLKEFFGLDHQQAAAAEAQQSQQWAKVRRQTRAKQPVSPPVQNCRLKMFTVDDWKVTVHVNNVASLMQCQRCCNTFPKGNSSCPKCGLRVVSSDQPAGQPFGGGFSFGGPSFYHHTGVRCAKCGATHNDVSGRCPRCEPPVDPNTKALASIKEAVAKYVGQAARGQQAASHDSVPCTISDDIASIQSSLAEW